MAKAKNTPPTTATAAEGSSTDDASPAATPADSTTNQSATPPVTETSGETIPSTVVTDAPLAGTGESVQLPNPDGTTPLPRATGGDPANTTIADAVEASGHDRALGALPVGVAGSPLTRDDVPKHDQTETAQGGDAKLKADGSVPVPKLGVEDDDDAQSHLAALPIGVAGSPFTRKDVFDGDPGTGGQIAPAVEKTGPDQPYRLITLSFPVVDMHGYARREMFLSSENADTLRDLAAGLASVGEKLDGTVIDRPEKALDWLLTRIREEVARAKETPAETELETQDGTAIVPPISESTGTVPRAGAGQ